MDTNEIFILQSAVTQNLQLILRATISLKALEETL